MWRLVQSSWNLIQELSKLCGKSLKRWWLSLNCERNEWAFNTGLLSLAGQVQRSPPQTPATPTTSRTLHRQQPPQPQKPRPPHQLHQPPLQQQPAASPTVTPPAPLQPPANLHPSLWWDFMKWPHVKWCGKTVQKVEKFPWLFLHHYKEIGENVCLVLHCELSVVQLLFIHSSFSRSFVCNTGHCCYFHCNWN